MPMEKDDMVMTKSYYHQPEKSSGVFPHLQFSETVKYFSTIILQAMGLLKERRHLLCSETNQPFVVFFASICGGLFD